MKTTQCAASLCHPTIQPTSNEIRLVEDDKILSNLSKSYLILIWLFARRSTWCSIKAALKCDPLADHRIIITGALDDHHHLVARQSNNLAYDNNKKWQMLSDSLAASMSPLNVIHSKSPHCNQNLSWILHKFPSQTFMAAHKCCLFWLPLPIFWRLHSGHLSHFVILLYLLCTLINRWNHFWLISVDFPVFSLHIYIYLIFWEWILHITWKIDCVKSWMMYLDNYCQHMKYKAPPKFDVALFPYWYHFLCDVKEYILYCVYIRHVVARQVKR